MIHYYSVTGMARPYAAVMMILLAATTVSNFRIFVHF